MGPRTAEGKARCARNAYRGGFRPESRRHARECRELLAQMSALLDAVTDPAPRRLLSAVQWALSTT